MKSKIETEIESAYGEAFPNQAIDPATVIGLITAVFQIIQGCRGGASAAKASMKRGDVHSKIGIRRAIKQEHPEMDRKERKELFKATLKRLNDASDQDIDDLVEDATDGGTSLVGDMVIPLIAIVSLILSSTSLQAGPFTSALRESSTSEPSHTITLLNDINPVEDEQKTFDVSPFTAAVKICAVEIGEGLGPDRVVILTSKDCPACPAVKGATLRGLSWMMEKANGWSFGEFDSRKFQFIDVTEQPDFAQIVEDSIEGELTLPFIGMIEDGNIVRTWQPGCNEPMDQWTLGWLYKGINERPGQKPVQQVTVAQSIAMPKIAQYPLRGRWWSVGSTWNASRNYVLSHLKSSPNHSGMRRQMSSRGIPISTLDSMSREQLNSLHSDDHENRIAWGSWKTGSSSPSRMYVSTTPTQPATTRQTQPMARPAVSQSRTVQRQVGCPTGNCPWAGSQSYSRKSYRKSRKR